MNKIFNLVLQLILPLTAVCFVIENLSNISNVRFIFWGMVSSLNTGEVIACAYLTGLITGLVFLVLNKTAYTSKIDFYLKKNEKLAQENEIKSDDKKALEMKVAALEKALQSALNKNKEK